MSLISDRTGLRTKYTHNENLWDRPCKQFLISGEPKYCYKLQVTSVSVSHTLILYNDWKPYNIFLLKEMFWYCIVTELWTEVIHFFSVEWWFLYSAIFNFLNVSHHFEFIWLCSILCIISNSFRFRFQNQYAFQAPFHMSSNFFYPPFWISRIEFIDFRLIERLKKVTSSDTQNS